LSAPAVATVNTGITVAGTVSGASAANANITYLVTTSSNITAKDLNGNTLVATTLNSPVIVGNDTFNASYSVPADASGNVKAVFTSTASSSQTFNVVVEAPFSNNGQPVMSNEASMEWGVPGTTVLSPVYTSSNPDNLNFSTSGSMKGLVPVVATILPATGSTTAVSGQQVKFTMTDNTAISTSDANAYFTDAVGSAAVASNAFVGKGQSPIAPITYVGTTDTNGQALVYINSQLPTNNGVADLGAVMNVSVQAQLVNGGGSTNTGTYQWKAVSQAAKIANVSPSAMLNPTGLEAGGTLVSTNAQTSTSGSQTVISGTLEDSAGNPVKSAQVAIQDYNVLTGNSNNVQNDAFVSNGTTTLFSAVNYPTVTTDANGNFSVTVTANVPVTQSVANSQTKYYAYYIPSTIAVTSGQSLPTTVTPLSFVGDSNNGYITLVWQQGQTAQTVGVSHTSLMPNYASLSAVPQIASFSNVVGSDEQMFAAAYNQTGTIIAPAVGNQFDGYALTYDITAPSGVYFEKLGQVLLPTLPGTNGTTYGIGEIKAHYTQTGMFVVDSANYNDPSATSATSALTVATTAVPNPYASAYDGSGQINFYLQSNSNASTITSGTAGSVNVNISAYSNTSSLGVIDTTHAQGSASGTINAAFTASNTISTIGVAGNLSGFNNYSPLLQGNAAPGANTTITGVALPSGNVYDASNNASFVVAPFNSYPAMGTIPSQGLTMNLSSNKNGVITNVDGYSMTSNPSNASVNVNSLGEVSVNNVKIWTATPGYKVVGYSVNSPTSVTILEENTTTAGTFSARTVNPVTASTIAGPSGTWTGLSATLANNFEGYLGFNVKGVNLIPEAASKYTASAAWSVADAQTATPGLTAVANGVVFSPVTVATASVSDKYSETPTITISNSLNSQTATVAVNFNAAQGGMVAVKSDKASVNSVIGSAQSLTLTAQDSYGNALPSQTIYLGTGAAMNGLWLTQVNGSTITGSVVMGGSTSSQTVNTPIPLNGFAGITYPTASSTGVTAYNLTTASPVIALQTGMDGTVSITLVDGNVQYINGTCINAVYTVASGVNISNQTLTFSSAVNGSTLGSVNVNFNGAALTGVSTALNMVTAGVTQVLAPATVTGVTGTDTLTVGTAPTAPGIVGLNVDGNPISFTLAGSETVAQTATAIYTALNANAYVTTNYTLSAPTGATVTLVEKTQFTNKLVTYQAGSTGSVVTSAQTPAGVTGVTIGAVQVAAKQAVYNLVVGGSSYTAGTLNVTFRDGTINTTVQVPVLVTDNATTVATAIAGKLNALPISAAYSITNTTPGTVTITQNAPGSAVTVTVTVQG